MLLLAVQFNLYAQRHPHKYVDPFIGTANNGNTLPGPSLPFSFMRLGPDNPVPHPTSGYDPLKPIKGFSHTHVSGTGGNGQYGNLSVMPTTGPLLLQHFESEKAGEVATAGYYKVQLTRYNILAELTQTEKVGLHRYSFPASSQAHILFDVSSMIKKNGSNNFMRNLHTEASVKGNIIQGYGEYVGGWGNDKPNKIFFYAIVNKASTQAGSWLQDSVFSGYGKNKLSGKDGGIVFSFSTTNKEEILLKVGISPLNVEAAKLNVEKEMPGWDFEAVKAAAERKWDEYLTRIKITGASEAAKKTFYTALYHVLVMPSDITGQNPGWVSSEPAFWDFYTLWDTFRTSNPLLTLVAPLQQRRIVRSLLDIYKHHGWLPDAWIVGGYASKQGGTNADVLIADAIVKDLGGFNYEEAYKAIKKNADSVSPKPWWYGRHKEYAELNYCPSSVNCGTSYTLEYSYNDFCIAQVAKRLGYEADAVKYAQLSQNCFNLFNEATGFFWAKNTEGIWEDGFKPAYKRTHQQSGYFYEGTPYQYSFYVPHDINGLISRLGGKEAFLKYLDVFFDSGFYRNDNQPDIQVPFLYNYIGRPDKTADRVRTVLKNSFKPTADGLPGNDDAGCMSAWYVFSAMGFYPVPGQDIYLIASPIFKKVQMKLEDNKTFTIIAQQTSEVNKYILSATLNGKPLYNTWFRHSDIITGGRLELVMGPKYNGWGRQTAIPPSVSLIKSDISIR